MSLHYYRFRAKSCGVWGSSASIAGVAELLFSTAAAPLEGPTLGRLVPLAEDKVPGLVSHGLCSYVLEDAESGSGAWPETEVSPLSQR